MTRPAWIVTSLLAVTFGLAASTATAGLGSFFSSSRCDSCQTSDCKCKKKSCLFDVDDPPRAPTVTAVPAQLTNQRAERAPQKPQSPAVPPAPACNDETSTEKQIEDLQRDIRILKEQFRVLSTLIQENSK